jgi:hypothetical protein
MYFFTPTRDGAAPQQGTEPRQFPERQDFANCSAVREFSLAAFEFGIEYRLLLVLVYVTGINVLLRHMQTRVVPRLHVYQHLAPEVTEELAVRCMQLCFSPIIATGYLFLAFSAATGCDASEIYLLFIGGGLLNAADLHEWVRRWPLRSALLAHHVMVFGITLCFTDFRVLPAVRGQPVDIATIILICNIGLCWATDFFHVIFRASSSLPIIERARRVYLCLSIIRLSNIGLLVASSVRAGLAQSWVGMAFAILMNLAYIHNTQRALRFVWGFDCAKYFNSHQAKWALEEAAHIEATPAPSDATMSTVSEAARVPTPLKRNSRLVSGGLSGRLAIDFSEPLRSTAVDEHGPQRGIRGDVHVERELADFAHGSPTRRMSRVMVGMASMDAAAPPAKI